MYRPGDAVARAFNTFNAAGALTNADSLPTAVVVRNGVDDATPTVTVTNVSAGRYKATFTLPTTYAARDRIEIYVAFAMGAVSTGGTLPIGPLTTDAEQGIVARGTVGVDAAANAGALTLSVTGGGTLPPGTLVRVPSRRAAATIVSGTGSYVVTGPTAALTNGDVFYALAAEMPSTDLQLAQAVRTEMDDNSVDLDAIIDALSAITDLVETGLALSTEERDSIATAILDLAGAADGYTFRQILRLITALLAGRVSGHPTAPVFRNALNTKDRVSFTLDEDGNRTGVVIDLT